MIMKGEKRWLETIKKLGSLPECPKKRDTWLSEFNKMVAESFSPPPPQNIDEGD